MFVLQGSIVVLNLHPKPKTLRIIWASDKHISGLNVMLDFRKGPSLSSSSLIYNDNIFLDLVLFTSPLNICVLNTSTIKHSHTFWISSVFCLSTANFNHPFLKWEVALLFLYHELYLW